MNPVKDMGTDLFKIAPVSQAEEQVVEIVDMVSIESLAPPTFVVVDDNYSPVDSGSTKEQETLCCVCNQTALSHRYTRYAWLLKNVFLIFMAS